MYREQPRQQHTATQYQRRFNGQNQPPPLEAIRQRAANQGHAQHRQKLKQPNESHRQRRRSKSRDKLANEQP
jgi:DNA replication protein DnaC